MNRIALASLGVLFSCQSNVSQAAWLVKKIEDGEKTKIISVSYIKKNLSKNIVELRSIPAQISESSHPSHRYVEILYADNALPQELAHMKNQYKNQQNLKHDWPGAEIRTIVSQGPKENRINLPIIAEGYTEAEKEKFFQDATRITNELFTGDTFASYLSLFNVYAIFVPSRESGLGDIDNRKDTALKLYRELPNSKRAILYDDETTIPILDRLLALAPASDYPILLVNDDFYGGLGGEYAITTRSERSGMIVLRHELGHNFGNVGEEYDNGSVYEGANFSATKNVPWKHWINGSTEVYNSKVLSAEYLWKTFKEGPFKINFNFPNALPQGSYLFHTLISAVSWKTPEDIKVYLDGQPVEMNGSWSEDRNFFTLNTEKCLAPGRHTLEFNENIFDPNHVFASAILYAHPFNIDTTVNKVAAFSVFNEDKTQVGYRPTFDTCLMKNMERHVFCAIDQENMWNRFLEKVDLIDDIKIVQQNNMKIVTLNTPNLSGLSMRWYTVTKNGTEVELPEYFNKNTWSVSSSNASHYRVKVHFETSQVRKPTSRYFSQKDFVL